MTSALLSVGEMLVAGNTDAASQVRVWDVREGVLTDRFSLPGYVKGVRCLAQVGPHHVVAGCTNGWLLSFDLRTGRYEKRMAHTDCIAALAVQDGMLVSVGREQARRAPGLT